MQTSTLDLCLLCSVLHWILHAHTQKNIANLQEEVFTLLKNLLQFLVIKSAASCKSVAVLTASAKPSEACFRFTEMCGTRFQKPQRKPGIEHNKTTMVATIGRASSESSNKRYRQQHDSLAGNCLWCTRFCHIDNITSFQNKMGRYGIVLQVSFQSSRCDRYMKVSSNVIWQLIVDAEWHHKETCAE